ncbi:MAG: hypothetical protein WC364_06840 [Eubacteriales bacterium]
MRRKRQPAVKDLIESPGVSHTEVDLILVNGDSVDFGRLVHDKDRISVKKPGAARSDTLWPGQSENQSLI